MRLPLPGPTDSVILVMPPVTVVEDRIFFHGHNLLAKNFHQIRLRDWLASRCKKVTFIDSVCDGEAGPMPMGTRTAGPRSSRPMELPYMRWGLERALLKRRLEEAGRPDQIWITTLFVYDQGAVFDTIRAVKEVYPDVPIAMGGVCASTSTDGAGAFGVDYLHRGLLREAEESIQAQDHAAGFVIGGRGCPNRCSYCAVRYMENVRPYMNEVDRILAAVDRMMDNGLSTLVYYTPSIFMGETGAVTEQLLVELAHRDISILSWSGLNPSILTARRASLLKGANAMDPMIPLQTLDRGIASKWGRSEGVATYLAALSAMREAGFADEEMATDVIVGHPDQTLEEAVRTACFVWSKGVSPLLFRYTIVPRSADARKWAARTAAMPLEAYHPYLWPLADPSEPVYNFMQLGILSRVLPQNIEKALEYLDPDTPVPAMIRRHLDELGFDIPQWRIDAPLPALTPGYHRFLSHPWELVLTLLQNGQAAAALPFIDRCEAVTVSEPEYMKVPRLFDEAGEKEATVRTMRAASRWLPPSLRGDLASKLDSSIKSSRKALSGVAGIVARALESNHYPREAARWRRLIEID